MCHPRYRWKRTCLQLTGKTENPNKRHRNKVLKGQKCMYGYKCLFIQGKSSHSGTTRARGEEEQGRHSFNCTTSVLGGRSPAWNGHSGWFRSSAPAFLSSSCSPEVGAASVHVWGDCRGARKGTVVLQRDLYQGRLGIPLQGKPLV